ncbi:MAG: uL13 family ribosomal protein, partial [Rhizomicrobium sp.]
QARQNGTIPEVVELDEGMFQTGLRAAAQRLPFLPMRAGAGAIMSGKHPERVVEKAVERMLPRGPLGRRQLSNLRVYPGTEHPHEAQQPQALDAAALNAKNANYRKAKAA